ncbi:MAG: hypothetical protein OXI38_06950 [Bacteroidota bacterium]|nr:hypothetical protein [Bacteroidota bacterium]
MAVLAGLARTDGSEAVPDGELWEDWFDVYNYDQEAHSCVCA